MTDLMISLLIFGVLSAMMAVKFSSGRKFRKVEETRASLLQDEKIAFHLIKQDLSRAVRINGYSGQPITNASGETTLEGFSGIQGRSDPRSTPTESDSITLYVEEFGDFNIPNITMRSSRIEFSNRSGPSYDLFRAAAQRNHYFLVSNLEFTNVVETPTPEGTLIAGEDEYINPHGHAASINIPFLTRNFRASDFANRITSLRMLSRITYALDDHNNLIRTREIKRSGDPEKTVVAKGVARFQVDYSFTKKRRVSGSAQLPNQAPCAIESGRLASLRDPDYVACSQLAHNQNPNLHPVTWHDVDALHIRLEIGSPIPSGVAVADASNDSGFSSQLGSDGSLQLVRAAELSLYPDRYNFDMGGQGLQGEDVCRVNDLSTHCNPDYSRCFRGVERSAPDWGGYGDINGAYCACGRDANGVFNAPELVRPALDWNANRARVMACQQAFDGCSGPNWWLQSASPQLQLICGTCLQELGTGGKYYQSYTPSGSYERYRITTEMPSADGNANQFHAVYESGTPNSNDLRCKSYHACDSAASNYFDGTDIVTRWAEFCGCFTKDLDDSGHATAEHIDGLEFDFNKLCHFNNHNECSNTRVSAHGAYRLAATDNLQGLSPEDAGLCQCVANQETEVDGLPRIQVGSDGRFDPSWDFRARRSEPNAPDPGDPGPFAPPAPSLTFGSDESHEVGNMPVQGGAAIDSHTQCDLLACRDGRFSLSCCSAQSQMVSDLQLDPNINTPWEGSHSSYCNSTCTGAPNNEIDIVRRQITGVGANGILPPYCGGPRDSNSGNLGSPLL